MNFCSECGARVSVKVPDGDNMPRHVCDECTTIHYQNPKLVVGCIVEYDQKILFCKRAIEPRYGLWTLPAGFMENAETTAEAAARETHEEANAEVEIIDLFSQISLPHINQIYMLYRARFSKVDFGPGSESLEVELLTEDEVPWSEMAFPVITENLKLYFEDRRTGHFSIHSGDMIKRADEHYAFDLNLHGEKEN